MPIIDVKDLMPWVGHQADASIIYVRNEGTLIQTRNYTFHNRKELIELPKQISL